MEKKRYFFTFIVITNVCFILFFVYALRMSCSIRCPNFELEIVSQFPNLVPGGHFIPKTLSTGMTAIIIPYRKREMHLKMFLPYIHIFLKKQNIEYVIYVVEQSGNKPFNRNKIFNVGVMESLKEHNVVCFIFHDVDLFPENDELPYKCEDQPIHLSVAVDKFNYKLSYKELFGGVTALSKEQIFKINGFSNLYWGWGGEDDDTFIRLRRVGYKIKRHPENISRYKMVVHKSFAANSRRYILLRNAAKRMAIDGLNMTQYKILNVAYRELYTLIQVDIA